MSDLVKRASSTFFGSALVGSGIFFGKDVYKGAKKNFAAIMLILVAVGAFYLPYYAGKDMFRGHRRGIIATLFKTLLLNICLLFIAYGIIDFFGALDQQLQHDQQYKPLPATPEEIQDRLIFLFIVFGYGIPISIAMGRWPSLRHNIPVTYPAIDQF